MVGCLKTSHRESACKQHFSGVSWPVNLALWAPGQGCHVAAAVPSGTNLRVLGGDPAAASRRPAEVGIGLRVVNVDVPRALNVRVHHLHTLGDLDLLRVSILHLVFGDLAVRE